MKINLVPEVKQEQLRIRKLNMIVTTTATVLGVAFGAVILILLGYNIARKTQISGINTETTKINNELEAYKDLENTVVSLETGLSKVKQVLSGGPKWSKFLTELEKVTPGDVQVVSFNIQGNAISMELLGKDVKSIDRFIKSFSNYKYGDSNLFTEVEVNGYTKTDKGVNFSAKMNMVGGLIW